MGQIPHPPWGPQAGTIPFGHHQVTFGPRHRIKGILPGHTRDESRQTWGVEAPAPDRRIRITFRGSGPVEGTAKGNHAFVGCVELNLTDAGSIVGRTMR